MIDLSKFFITYTPYTPKKPSEYVLPAWLNPYSDLNLLGTSSDTKLTNPYKLTASLFESLGWITRLPTTETLTDNETDESTLTEEQKQINLLIKKENEGEKKTNNTTFDGTERAFIKSVEPAVRTSLTEANKILNLGLSSLQLDDAVRRITLLFMYESTRGTSNVARRNNNLGGLKYVLSLAKFNGRRGTAASDGGYYTYFPTIIDFFNAYFAPAGLYMRKYKNVLYAKSDREFVQTLKNTGYFTDTVDRYYTNTFNSKAMSAYNNYRS